MTARHGKFTKRLRRASARRLRISFSAVLALVAAPFLLAGGYPAGAQSVTTGETVNGAMLAGSGLEVFSGVTAKSPAGVPGTGLTELLRGNGSARRLQAVARQRHRGKQCASGRIRSP